MELSELFLKKVLRFWDIVMEYSWNVWKDESNASCSMDGIHNNNDIFSMWDLNSLIDSASD